MWRRYFIFIFSNIQTGLDSRDGNVTRPHCPCHARTMQQTKIKCWTSNLKFPFYFPKMTPANSILKGKKKQNKTKTRNNNNFIHACTLHKYIIHSLSQPVKNKALVFNILSPRYLAWQSSRRFPIIYSAILFSFHAGWTVWLHGWLSLGPTIIYRGGKYTDTVE